MKAWNSTLNAGGPMRRTAPLRSYGTLHKKARKPRSFGELPKALGKMLVGKLDHWRSEEHLALIRTIPCLRCRMFGLPARYCGPSEAHHPRELFERAMGRRRNDFLCVPLCTQHHSDQYPEGVHRVNDESWWLDFAMPGFPYRMIEIILAKNYAPGTNAGADEALKLVRLHRERA